MNLGHLIGLKKASLVRWPYAVASGGRPPDLLENSTISKNSQILQG